MGSQIVLEGHEKPAETLKPTTGRTPPLTENLFPDVPRRSKPVQTREFQKAIDDKISKLKVGDWVRYTVKEMGQSSQCVIKLVDLKPTEYTTSMEYAPKRTKGTDSTRSLYHPTYNNRALREGKETIKIGDKEYECTWCEQLRGAWIEGQADRAAYVIEWFCPDAPWNGVVRRTYIAPGIRSDYFYVAHGSKEDAPE